MAGHRISDELWKSIYELGKRTPRLSNRKIADILKCKQGVVFNYRDLPFTSESSTVVSEEEPQKAETELQKEIKSRLKRKPFSEVDLANALDVSPKRIQSAIQIMRAQGTMLLLGLDGKWDITSPITAERGVSEVSAGDNEGDWTHIFGVVSDNHLCNRHSRLDVLNQAYDTFASMGIKDVYNPGNWVDGEKSFNKTELIVAPGMDNQLDYMIDNYPQRPGITTHYIAGDDHEGWYAQRECIEIGKYLQLRAEDQGRHDLHYLGYAEADVKLKNGVGEAVMRVVHPGGGSSYAISYTEQKLVESYQGGEKPQVLLVGHYHKYNTGYPREVHTVQCGCTCDQTLFMRKHKLQAMVGYLVIKIKQDPERGHITRFAPEWFPFYDRGFYEKRY